ncbi:GlsB/YeaQ/YmgE family stress response membrane protein [Roseicyclus sp.]|uniref:GlsB/YeaQ/YmgE family stress response membrane protein n=1 Tax=Roseicyclus sp. TaxID=1914329 RepID=UPI003FA01217
MQGVGWFLAIIVGGFAGWIAEKLMKADHGLLKNIILGILGALIGNFILEALNIAPPVGLPGQLIVAVAGASLLIWIGRAFRRR